MKRKLKIAYEIMSIYDWIPNSGDADFSSLEDFHSKFTEESEMFTEFDEFKEVVLEYCDYNDHELRELIIQQYFKEN